MESLDGYMVSDFEKHTRQRTFRKSFAADESVVNEYVSRLIKIHHDWICYINRDHPQTQDFPARRSAVDLY